jgi:dinuclear metal center YbgI/SA1388 family protein
MGAGDMMMVHELAAYLGDFLDVAAFDDYAPNGLQVEGRLHIGQLIGGVTASQALIDAAIERQADAILVHHGYFWNGEDPCVTGMKQRRLKSLLAADISLLAYHLPLDAHAQLGNNAQLARLFGCLVQGSFGGRGGPDLAMYGELPHAMSALQLRQMIARVLQREPLHIAGADKDILRLGWCSGGAQSYFEAAVALGLDAFISGEVSEQCTHIARETGVHYFAAGHHATERYGVQALGQHLNERFDLAFEFIDIDNPV